ncbi:MAG: hypothetical protein KatS3mg109_0635 [Pirellulaceae bacterium]|nr:MAG: hypothetical protein KatS3mg109_0635 [Pirellulaceae bacterium]GIW93458.1 MAG: hypothetical protein KatS3mg110_1499 [Pirellulaceae bacterium]
MDQASKQAVMMAILAFCITLTLFMVLFNAGLPPLRWQFSVVKVLLGILIAGGAAAGGYFAARMSQ